MKDTQHSRIKKYIEDFGSITPMQAFIALGITKLSTRIGEMIREGTEIEKEMIYDKDKFGDPVHYMRYSLKKEAEY